MRIVAGSAKGMRLAPVPTGVRPLSDRAREGLFSSLAGRVAGALVLDLYAGTGALGIEALSRGAAEAVLVDREAAAARAIRTNLERTGLTGLATVRRRDVALFLRDRRARRPFDLCFLDPPYATGASELARVLGRLCGGWLAPGWTVVLTRATGDHMVVVPVDWRVTRRLAYGGALVALYREV